MSSIRRRLWKVRTALAGLPSRTRRPWLRSTAIAAVLVVGLFPHPATAAGADIETNAAAALTSETNSLETLRAYLQLQEQLQLTQLAIEQNRKEARETAAQSSELLIGRLQTIEKVMEAQRSLMETQRARELEAMQSSNRAMLLVAGTFAGIGFLAMFLMSFFQWRTVNRLAEISAALPASLALGSGRSELGVGEGQVVTVGPAEQSSVRLLSAMEQMERRIYELEHSTRSSLHEGTSSHHGGTSSSPSSNENGGPAHGTLHVVGHPGTGSSMAQERVNVLLGKGQSMLNLDRAQSALACFDEVLSLEPDNTEAWIKKGMALERLQQLNEAVECYDRAIAANGSLTIAYLHKGGLFNRMEKFNEALECYEKALRTQERRQEA